MSKKFVLLIFCFLFSLCRLLAQQEIKGTSNRLNNVDINGEATDIIAPAIELLDPPEKRGFKIIVEETTIVVKVKVTDQSGVSAVNINGQKANFAGADVFQASVSLGYGDNTITVKATDTKNNSAEQKFIIERKDAPVVVQPNDQNSPMVVGKYYALIIGNNVYSDPTITPLSEPVNDATKLYNVLTTTYTFDVANVTFLKNAKYEEMIGAFDKLSSLLTSNDNLLIFYAGHGWWDEERSLGYWLPTDAKKSSTAFWLRNSTISDYISSIKAKHTLLIADACFSGSIFKTRTAFNDASAAINKLYELPSRKAMTSGALKEVPDKSVFLQYLVNRLKENTDKYISADQLFASFRIAVLNNSENEPLYGTIQNAGDEGGEFIFIKK